ncbi:thiamine biosynthesis lipoprotein [Marmoricola sp. OAE513]|uniref:FAD:protein FMN transferase n=1 Tax=Marmoricola sp. OAE513 TaxID=2817894 RepID=UPI001AE7DEA0
MTAALEWSVWSTTARVVVTEPAVLEEAHELCVGILTVIGAVASRFDPGSEISVLPDDGLPHPVSPLLADLVAEALSAAEITNGAVDPTVGSTLIDLGYDRDITLLESGPESGGSAVAQIRQVRGWRCVRLSRDTLTVPVGVVLDLGATAKASAADRCARAVAARFRCGVLVALGGDIATAGAGPDGGWQVRVQDLASDRPDQVTLPSGWAICTSSTQRRTWDRDGCQHHHVIDPRTSRPVADTWASVSVVARTCLAANTASTAALVHGRSDLSWLARLGLPSRALARNGSVYRFGGWPREDAA